MHCSNKNTPQKTHHLYNIKIVTELYFKVPDHSTHHGTTSTSYEMGGISISETTDEVYHITTSI